MLFYYIEFFFCEFRKSFFRFFFFYWSICWSICWSLRWSFRWSVCWSLVLVTLKLTYRYNGRFVGRSAGRFAGRFDGHFAGRLQPGDTRADRAFREAAPAGEHTARCENLPSSDDDSLAISILNVGPDEQIDPHRQYIRIVDPFPVHHLPEQLDISRIHTDKKNPYIRTESGPAGAILNCIRVLPSGSTSTFLE